MIQKRQINVPIFNHALTLMTGRLEEVLKYLSGIHHKDLNGIRSMTNALALCILVNNEIYIWWEKDVQIPALGHEVCHAVFAIMDSRGIHVDDQEVFCYLWQYIMEQILCTLPEQMGVINHQ